MRGGGASETGEDGLRSVTNKETRTHNHKVEVQYKDNGPLRHLKKDPSGGGGRLMTTIRMKFK